MECPEILPLTGEEMETILLANGWQPTTTPTQGPHGYKEQWFTRATDDIGQPIGMVNVHYGPRHLARVIEGNNNALRIMERVLLEEVMRHCS